jgi:hypothetical protein
VSNQHWLKEVNMNIDTVNTMMQEAIGLLQKAAEYQAKHGKAPLGAGSSDRAWALHDQMVMQQGRIARLLEPHTLDNFHHKYGMWWQHQDMMDVNTAQQLIQEIGCLLARCAYRDANHDGEEWSYAILIAQCTIAGMLHPASRQLGQDTSISYDELRVG